MSFIKILDENTINKIAAGEVIEKPASIVKELVENSIDAGANDITIEVVGGGITSIRISDNGKGVDAEDLENAFMRHATSKISSDLDLETISSLGFRGEALASIAAVAKVEMISRLKGSQMGNKIVIHGGKTILKEQCGCPEGTIISIQEVFFNTPARLKFLKSESREGMYITDVVEGIALSNTKVSIKYRLNGKMVLSTRGDGDLKSVLLAVYGKEIFSNVLPLEHMKEFIGVKGYIGNANIAKSSRNNQSMFINGRIIRNKTITAAVEAAFKSMLTINKFPFFVVTLVINPEFVDVNVHPSKAEVKFQDDQLVFKAVYAAVKDALIPLSDLTTPQEDATSGKTFVANVPKVEYKQETLELPEHVNTYHRNTADRSTQAYSGSTLAAFTGAFAEPVQQQQHQINETPAPTATSTQAPTPLSVPLQYETSTGNGTIADVQRKLDKDETQQAETKPIGSANVSQTNHKAASSIQKEEGVYLSLGKVNTDNRVSQETPKEQSIDPIPRVPKFEPLSIVGQLHFMYIIAEGQEEMYMIDQHAAHERIYYEKYLAAFNRSSIQSQNLLVPVIVELSLSEKQCVLENLTVFEKLGYDIEDFGGNAISIRAIPVIYGNPNTSELFQEIIQSIDLKTRDVYSAIDMILYKMSCKSAIKAGDKLGYKEMAELLEQLRFCDNPFNCPHGRPTIVKTSYYDLEKKFKRIQ